MLDQHDLQQIGQIVDKTVRTHLDDFRGEMGEMVETSIMPQFEELGQRMTKVESRLQGVENEVKDLKMTVANLPDKAYISDKLADLEGQIIVREKKADAREKKLVSMLHFRKVFNDADIQTLEDYRVFPS